MIDPLSIGIMTAASVGMQASATRQQGNLAMQSARRNAELLGVQNQQDGSATLESMARRRVENNRALAGVRTRLAASGIRSDTGSRADYLQEASSRMELQILDEARQQDFRSRARSNQADAEIYQGKVAKANSKSMAMAQLVQGGARIAGQAYDFKQSSRKGEFANNAFGGGFIGQKWF